VLGGVELQVSNIFHDRTNQILTSQATFKHISRPDQINN